MTTSDKYCLKNPVSFDEDWDTSKIPNEKKLSLIVSKIMYTGLLEEILKNDNNLNVIIDKNSDSGLVYKNNTDKYVKMSKKDIVDIIMNKLQKHLLELNNYCSNLCFEEFIIESKRVIIQKNTDYHKNSDIQKIVQDFITNMYETKKKSY
jgi:hypothetical protein